MKKIIIVCAGSVGKEIYTVIDAINLAAMKENKARPFEFLGFIDDNPNVLVGSTIKAKLLGNIVDWKPLSDEVYAMGVADLSVKMRLVENLKARGCRFVSIIAPWSIISEDCVMGEGCFITAYSISAGVKIGNFVNVMGSMLCPGTIIGDYSSTTGFTVVDNAIIGKGVFVGSHAVITCGVKVGDYAKVSAGSIVTEDVAIGATVFGVPASSIM